VQGNHLELERIVKECGCHALTVDLAGGYITEYGNGDPSTPLTLGTPEELEAEAQQEPDPAKRAVLKQGKRFARVAQRYREAMVQNDPAAIALLERICLFRLGVEASTLETIFTGENAVKVSGEALSRLSPQELQRKLNWLVQMRIIEVTYIKLRQTGQTRTIYNIHPAVRDGFMQGIGQDVATVSHEAIRTGLEVSLGDAPGENPSDPATLDMLEEIVYHAMACGQVQEAWEVYWYKIGGYENLGWRLGDYERGERICRQFGGGQSPEAVVAVLQGPQPTAPEPLPCLALSEDWQASFINEWALYLQDLGRLDAAARCYEANIPMRMRQQSWKNASSGNRNLSAVGLRLGRLGLAQATAAEALSLAEQADDARGRQNSYGFQGRPRGCGVRWARPWRIFASASTGSTRSKPMQPTDRSTAIAAFSTPCC
jgi:tetratricopeptide (TPR) repeat protein